MSTEALVSLVMQGVNFALLLAGGARYMLRVERRLMHIEIRLGIKDGDQ